MSARDLVQTFFARMDVGDVEGTLALVAPEAPVNLIPLQLQGNASEVGRDYFQQLASAFPNLQVRMRRLFVGSDNTAVAEVTIEGNQAADFFGILNQEKLMDLDQVWLLHVGDGAIDRIKAYWCQNRLYRRLGVKRLDHITITA
jgi:ketosteroid isomerase-like protein